MNMRAVILAVACATSGALAVTSAPTSGNTNPQQQICAQPPKLCPSQMKVQSCINWHGCKWEDGKCWYDETCKTGKATVVPTVFVPPTPPTVPRPTTKAPTPKPTKCDAVPSGGNCFTMKTEETCAQFRCCKWEGVRCAYFEPPTPAPTTAKPTAPPSALPCKDFNGDKPGCQDQDHCRWCGHCSSKKCRTKKP